jgi:hypothetical protein
MVCIVTRVVPSGKWKLPFRETPCAERFVEQRMKSPDNKLRMRGN